MISIKLKKIGESNQAAVDVMDGQENLPFYEPIVASQLPETPDVLIKLYNKEQSTSEVLVFLCFQKYLVKKFRISHKGVDFINKTV